VLLFFLSCHLSEEKNEAQLLQYHQLYQKQLKLLRSFCRTQERPPVTFFLFGMGNRPKLLYKQGMLVNVASGEPLNIFDFETETIIPNEYAVLLKLKDGQTILIDENEDGIWLQGKKRERINGTTCPLNLPRFNGHPYSEILRVLHHELLINIMDSRPLPNWLVYHNPWRRDAATMAMCLQKTDNLSLIKNWVLDLDDPFDHNNGSRSGHPENEADNLGQTLYLLSLFSDSAHPLVKKILAAAQQFTVSDSSGSYICGRSDFQQVPVYQTKWLKFGLQSLHLPDAYQIPAVFDQYSSLFWWEFGEYHVNGDDWTSDLYPYIGWARDHFYHRHGSPISDQEYPLTWETQASEADYEGMALIDPIFTQMKTCAPHTWHAAEVFLYLLDTKMIYDVSDSRMQ